MEKKYTRKYGDIGKLAVLQQRLLSDLTVKMDWEDFGKTYILYFKNIGSSNAIHINNASWNVFLHVTNPKVLSFAVELMESHKEESFEAMDTYANLLYKVRDKQNALIWEKKAINLSIENHEDPNDLKELQHNLEKMKEGEPTWKG